MGVDDLSRPSEPARKPIDTARSSWTSRDRSFERGHSTMVRECCDFDHDAMCVVDQSRQPL